MNKMFMTDMPDVIDKDGIPNKSMSVKRPNKIKSKDKKIVNASKADNMLVDLI